MRDWTVLPNERFNIRGYTGLNICFVYNGSADDWETAGRCRTCRVHRR